MSRPRKGSDDPRQLSLLELLERRVAREEDEVTGRVLEGELNDDGAVRAILAEDIKGCPLSRPEIAGRLTHYLGREVSRAMIDAWTATSESHEGHRFPLGYARAWCRATGSDRLLRQVAERLGLFVMEGPEALRAEIQRLAEEESRVRAERRKRVAFLGAMEGKG